MEIDSLVIESNYILGKSYYFKGEYFNAFQSLNKALKIANNSGVKNPVIFYFLAKAYYSLGDYENAIQNAITAKYKDFQRKKQKRI